MTLWTGARPAPGTTDLLEVLDRALTGGIAIASDRRINVVALGRASDRARLVVKATDIYLRHPEPEPGERAVARVGAQQVVADRVREQPKRRHG
ncbi:MAG: hypothetical protein WEA34_03230 [Gemmatimonadota bacterium]